MSSRPNPSAPASASPGFSWSLTAAQIVEEILPRAGSRHHDLLLDLRSALLCGTDWAGALDLFLSSRIALEQDHYIPFYRLRQILSHHLALEVEIHPETARRADLRRILQKKYRFLAHISKAVARERFESCLPDRPTPLRVREATATGG